MEDMQAFRTWGSLTPGHPEFGHTAGVETTTGPLGAGVATAVGFAMAARYERGLLDPDAAQGESIFDHDIWVLCSDGDLQEGVSAEASSLAGTQELGNLNVIYDDNRISIEGDTHVSFTEDVAARYRAYGWHVQEVATLADGDIDLAALDAAMLAAKAEKVRPSLIRMHSVIAWPAPKLRGTAKSHGSALGDEEIAATKVALGLNPEEKFAMPDDVFAHVRSIKQRGAALHAEWNIRFDTWKKANPERSALLARLTARELPQGWDKNLPTFEAGKDLATRAASGHVINAIAKVLPEFWGGSADLADSNNTTIEGGGSFLPSTSAMKGANPYGRIIHFGIREHAMGSILNGITLHGLSRTFGGTFAVFSDYMRPTARLAALMNIPTTFIWTHDSIGLGEDGPTHQPIEHLASLRAMPNFAVIRPADANEVTQAWKSILLREKPVGLFLSRQNLRTVDRSTHGDSAGVDKGAYILKEASSSPDVVIIATGSEVGLALDVQNVLEGKNVSTRVVSAPCLEWFKEEDAAYREKVIPSKAKLRVSIEAGVAQGWREYVGDSGLIISLDHFGASAGAAKLFNEFGFSVEKIVADIEGALK
jgi:transketolase